MTEGIIVQLITTAGLIIVAWLGNRKLNRIRDDTQETRKQTENEHKDEPYPNMRDELTAVRTSVERMDNRLEMYIADVDKDARSTRHSLERHIKASEREHAEIRKALSK